MPPGEALALARELLEQGRPFGAHEVLEAVWKAAPEVERDFWQGLAQVCVGLTHAARGNQVGAQRLVERGAGRLVDSAYRFDGMDVTAILAWARTALSDSGLAVHPPDSWPG